MGTRFKGPRRSDSVDTAGFRLVELALAMVIFLIWPPEFFGVNLFQSPLDSVPMFQTQSNRESTRTPGQGHADGHAVANAYLDEHDGHREQ